jgi:hypothetical protein
VEQVSGKFFLKDIVVNGEDIVNYNLQYPFFLYEGVTYFPLTADMKEIFGFETAVDWDTQEIMLRKTTPSLANIRENRVKNNAEDLTVGVEPGLSVLMPDDQAAARVSGGTPIRQALGGIVSLARSFVGAGEAAVKRVDLGDSPILVKDGVVYLPLRSVADSGALSWDVYYDPYVGVCVSTKDGVSAQSFFPAEEAGYNKKLVEYIRSKNKNLSVSLTQDLVFMFHRAAEVNQIDEKLLIAVAQKESNFNTRAVSSAGAAGIMQIMPKTASGYGISTEQLMDAKTNINCGAEHLSGQLERYEGNTGMALTAYNQGAGNVSRGTYSRGYAENIHGILAGIDAHVEAGDSASK